MLYIISIKIITMTDGKIKQLYIQPNLVPPKIEKVRSGVRVEYVNEDLKQAIKQMKQTMRKKSKPNLSLPGNKQQVTNPQKNEDSKKAQSLFYTQTYKKKMEARLYEIQERKKQLNALSLQKQMKARLSRKIKQNIQLRDKMDLLKDVYQRKELIMAERTQTEKRRKQEEKLMHQSSLINAQMSRKSKRKSMKKQLKQSRCEQRESLKDLQFKNYLTQKQKQQRQMLLNSRFQFLVRNKSESNVGLRDSLISNQSQRKPTMTISRFVKTSQNSRNKFANTKSQNQQKLIIEQYSNRNNESQDRLANEQKSQKKFNKGARKDSMSAQNENENENMKEQQEQARKIELMEKNETEHL